MVDVVAAHHQPGELLLHVAILVGGLGRTQRPKGVAAIFGQTGRHQVQRLVPRRLAEGAGVSLAFADQRRFDPVVVLDEGVPEPAFDAQHPHAGLVIWIVMGGDDGFRNSVFASIIHLKPDPAAHAAIGAGGADGVCRNGGSRWLFHADGSGGADAKALSAGGADAFCQWLVPRGGDPRGVCGAQDFDGADELVAGLAGIDAAGTQDAGVHRQVENRIGGVSSLAGARLPAHLGYAVQRGGIGQQAISGRGDRPVAPARSATHHTQRKLDDAGTDASGVLGIGADDHAIAGRRGARRREPANAVDLHQAGAAGPNGRHIGVFAQLRYRDASGIDGIQRRRAGRHGDGYPVNGEVHSEAGDGHGGSPSPGPSPIMGGVLCC